MKTLIKLLSDDTGATAVEYGLLAGLISLGLVAGLQGFSTSLQDVFDTVTEAMKGAPEES